MAGDSVKLTPSTRGGPSKEKKAAAISTVESEIVGVNEIDSFLKMCVYGRNKVGKTTFAASSDKKTLIIDCNEKGWVSIRRRKNVKVFPLKLWEQKEWVYWYLKSGKHDYDLVVIDTLSMLSSICMKWILKDEADRDSSVDPAMMTQPQWGKLAQLMKDTIIDFRNLPMDVIFLCQEIRKTSEDEDGGTVVEVRPDVSPATVPTLLSAVSVIGRIYTKEIEAKGKRITERRMLLGAHPVYASGNRYEELKPIERNPNLAEFYKRIEGDLNA